MSMSWQTHQFSVEMPQMVPGGKLSEVEFLKLLNAHQWRAIGTLLGRHLQDIVNDAGERLYPSLLNVEIDMGSQHSFLRFGEGTEVHIRNRINVYADRFVEGFFLISAEPIPDALLEKVSSRDDLPGTGLAWCYMANVFVAQMGSNSRLKVFKPAGMEDQLFPRLEDAPIGVEDHARVQSSGEIPNLPGERATPLTTRIDEAIPYRIVTESDLNGAGLLYFARYVAVCNYAERIYLNERLAAPVSTDFVASLSTEHRRIFYFGNASASDTIDVLLEGRVLLPGQFLEPEGPRPYRTPLQFEFRADLYRRSDHALIACSLVRKSLNVPASDKAVLAEAERFTSRLLPEGS